MPVSPARRAAFDILMRVEEEEAYASELLHSPKFDKLSSEDRGLTHEIVMGVLRWRSRLDQEIGLHSFTPLRKLDAAVLTALRMGAYQLRHLDRIPKHSAVDESVELVKSSGKASAAGLANAVLRKIASAKSVPKPATMADEFAHPAWLVERWSERFGLETAHNICEFDQQRPVTHIRIRAGNDVNGILTSLKAEGVSLRAGEILDSCWQVAEGDVTRTSAWKYRRVSIQDEGSQLVAHLAAVCVQEPQRILDCCAAPGGKTMLLAEKHAQAKVIAAELHPHRVETLKKLCNAPNVEVMQADATRFAFPDEDKFDLVLADVPCSGTGTLGRNPEIKWRLKPEKLVELNELQFAIAENALAQAKPGGVLVYSTCSLEVEENEAVVERLLTAEQCELVPLVEVRDRVPLQRQLRDDVASILSGSYLRTIPGRQSCDGFFAAVLRKTGLRSRF